MKIAIIGAGLAGTSCAYTFKKAGLSPEIYEAGSDIAGGHREIPSVLLTPALPPNARRKVIFMPPPLQAPLKPLI